MKRRSFFESIYRATGLSRAIIWLLLFFPAASMAEPVTLRQAVQLALEHATGIGVSAAEQQRANASYRELRNSYIPQLNVGAGIGYTDGFPLSLEGAAPSLVNVTAQSALFNPALSDFIRAAHDDVRVDSFNTKDQRDAVIQNVVLSYAELAKWERRLSGLRETLGEEEKMQAAVEQRVREGIDSEMDAARARLSVARIRLRLAEASGAVDVLREHLAKLTGVPTAAFEIDPESMPALPTVKQDAELAEKSSDASPAVQAAVERARAQFLRLRGEKKALWPTMDFAAQYANLPSFSNYEQYYTRGFQPNNVTVGAAVRFPFLNFAQHARIQQAEADALKANKQAEAARNSASEETLRLQRSVTQMQAAHDVAEIEYEISQQDVAAVKTRMQASAANLHDLDNAQMQVSERFIALQDVSFELERSQVALMRATGELEGWAVRGK
jgi:outer membrane protein TolC